MSGFQKFILRGNVVDLAVGVVIGAAFAAVVASFVKGFVTPLIGIFGGVPDFSQNVFEINGSRFLWGEFVNALLAFLLVALILYFFVVVPVNRLMDMAKTETPVEPTTRECPECLSKIPIKARRCAFCTTVLAGAEAAGAADGPVVAPMR